MLAIPMIPLQILLPVAISRYTVGPKPMDVFLGAIIPRLLMGLVYAGVVYITPGFIGEDGNPSVTFYVMILTVYALHQVSRNQREIMKEL